MGRQLGREAGRDSFLDPVAELVDQVFAHLQDAGGGLRRHHQVGAVVVGDGRGHRLGDLPFAGEQGADLAVVGGEQLPLQVDDGRPGGRKPVHQLEKACFARFQFDDQADVVEDAAQEGVVAVDGEDPLGDHLAADARGGAVQPQPHRREAGGAGPVAEHALDRVGDGDVAEVLRAEQGHGPGDGVHLALQAEPGAVHHCQQPGHQGRVEADDRLEVLQGRFLVVDQLGEPGNDVRQGPDLSEPVDQDGGGCGGHGPARPVRRGSLSW